MWGQLQLLKNFSSFKANPRYVISPLSTYKIYLYFLTEKGLANKTITPLLYLEKILKGK